VKAARIHGYGGSDSIRIERIALPTLRAGEILIEVRATGTNPIDWKIPAGRMQRIMPLKLPFTLGGDFSGVVLDTGPGASPFSVGEEVYGHAPIFMGSSGAFAEALITLAGNVARKPRGIGHPQAAALPLAGVSALQSLTERLRLSRNQRILIHGGAGGVGSIAIQLAKHLGARVVTTVSADDVAYVKSLGADEIIDYQRQRFEDAVGKVDAVLDTVGGDVYLRSFDVLRAHGRLVSLLERPQPLLWRTAQSRSTSMILFRWTAQRQLFRIWKRRRLGVSSSCVSHDSKSRALRDSLGLSVSSPPPSQREFQKYDCSAWARSGAAPQ
jgi:alcohol dehydrogenase